MGLVGEKSSCSFATMFRMWVFFYGVYLKVAGASKETQYLQRQKLRMFWKGTILFLEASVGRTCHKPHSTSILNWFVVRLLVCPSCWPLCIGAHARTYQQIDSLTVCPEFVSTGLFPWSKATQRRFSVTTLSTFARARF